MASHGLADGWRAHSRAQFSVHLHNHRCLLPGEQAETLSEELFILQIMGDDRAVAQIYVAGAPQKSGTVSTT